MICLMGWPENHQKHSASSIKIESTTSELKMYYSDGSWVLEDFFQNTQSWSDALGRLLEVERDKLLECNAPYSNKCSWLSPNKFSRTSELNNWSIFKLGCHHLWNICATIWINFFKQIAISNVDVIAEPLPCYSLGKHPARIKITQLIAGINVMLARIPEQPGFW